MIDSALSALHLRVIVVFYPPFLIFHKTRRGFLQTCFDTQCNCLTMLSALTTQSVCLYRRSGLGCQHKSKKFFHFTFFFSPKPKFFLLSLNPFLRHMIGWACYYMNRATTMYITYKTYCSKFRGDRCRIVENLKMLGFMFVYAIMFVEYPRVTHLLSKEEHTLHFFRCDNHAKM